MPAHGARHFVGCNRHSAHLVTRLGLFLLQMPRAVNMMERLTTLRTLQPGRNMVFLYGLATSKYSMHPLVDQLYTIQIEVSWRARRLLAIALVPISSMVINMMMLHPLLARRGLRKRCSAKG